MTKDKKRYSIIIIGGGPAGLATSLILSARGIDHCIVEANATPVLKPGEAIPPNARPLLRQLGIEDLLKNEAHHQYFGNKSYWGSEELYQEEFIKEVHSHGYLLNRSYFEQELRECTKQQACTFYNGYRLKRIVAVNESVTIEINTAQENKILTGKYIVDATGRKASVCRHLGIVKKQLDQQFTIVSQAKLTDPVEQQIYIEATENGWWYAAPMEKNKLSIMFFTLQELLPKKDKIFSFLQEQQKTSLLMSKLLKRALIDKDNFQLMPSGTSCLELPYGKQWLAVGDAAYAYDPISSYGITSALASGYYAGHALADTLDGKADALEVYRYLLENAFQGYLEKLKIHYEQERRWERSPYWERRMKI